jgi:hypothetical protein
MIFVYSNQFWDSRKQGLEYLNWYIWYIGYILYIFKLAGHGYDSHMILSTPSFSLFQVLPP